MTQIGPSIPKMLSNATMRVVSEAEAHGARGYPLAPAPRPMPTMLEDVADWAPDWSPAPLRMEMSRVV